MQRLERAGGFFATGHAEIQPLFFSRNDGVRIVLAGVAALSAVLLSHRRHHPPAQRATVGELHAIRQSHRRVVPGRVAVVVGRLCEWRDAGQQDRTLFRRQHGDTAGLEPEIAREKAVEPGALLR